MSTDEAPAPDSAAGTFIGDDAIVEVRNATVTFDMDRGESRVLDNLSVDVGRQEILGVVGESGSGKSMFASALLDAVVDPGVLTGDITYHPPDGQDAVDVLNLSQRELRRYRWEEVAMVFQGAMSSFNPTMSLKGHFKETLREHDYDVDEGIARTQEILRDLYLEPNRVLNSYPHELSGGMQQRTLIALSLVLQPEILVMDEPTAALDLLMQRSILKLIENLQEKYELTIVFITHDLPLVAELADRMAVMYAFQFAEVGPTERILHDAGHPYTRALLNATPNIDAPLEEMQPIDGMAPDPVNVPDGCSYHARCQLATAECEESDPAFREAGHTDHEVKCYHWDEAAEAIPFNIPDHVGEDE
jgi:oligopeptide/dipeptide ABC transporter ATP-binding protein